MNSKERREDIRTVLNGSEQAVSASALAERFHVSRQVIVSDIAILRAKGEDILSTPKGYIINRRLPGNENVFIIACLHGSNLMEKEIYTIVDNGGTLIDVIIEHPVYGQLSGQLNIASRYDADDFFEKVKIGKANLLSALTDGIHLHTVSCRNKDEEKRIKNALHSAGVLLGDNP